MKKQIFAGLALVALAAFAFADRSPSVSDVEAASLFGGCQSFTTGSCGNSGAGGVHLPGCIRGGCTALSGFVAGQGLEGLDVCGSACGGTCGSILSAVSPGCGT
jgi:hypothetical protein